MFTLEDQEGRLFKPLAYTKTFSMGFAALLSITVAPFLMTLLIRGRIPPEEKNPINRFLIWLYRPFARLSLRFRYGMVALAVLAVAAIVPIYMSLGSEFMPPLWEETMLYMPASLPGASIETMRQAIQAQDRILMSFPEVSSVFAKAGRAETATDPAPLEMVETVVNLKPPEQWRPGMTHERLEAEMDKALKDKQIGFSNSWTMPIKGRIDMLATGIRTPIGIKIFGPDLKEISRIGQEVENNVSKVPGTRTAFAEHTSEGYFLDFDIHRDAIARYGLTVADVEEVIQSAVGGADVTTTIEGRERYPVNVRYGRSFRSDLWNLKRALVETPTGAQVPMEQLADLHITSDPASIKTEEAQPVGYVYIDMAGRDPGSYIVDAKAAVDRNVRLPAGYHMEWSGSYEGMQRAGRRLLYVIPLTLLVIFVLLYFSMRSLTKVCIVFLAVPFSLVGAFLLLWLLGYNLSVAVWVGIIALAGVDAETGVVMLLYLDHRARPPEEGRPDEQPQGPGGRGDGGGGATGAAQDDDGDGDPDGPVADHVVHGDGVGRDEADRRPDGRRRRHLLPHGAADLPGDIHDLEMVGRGAAGRRPPGRRRGGGRTEVGRWKAAERRRRGGASSAAAPVLLGRNSRAGGGRKGRARTPHAGAPDSFVSEEVARWKGLRFDASLADMPCRRLSRPGRSLALVVAIDVLAGHPQKMWIMDVVWPITALYSGPLGLYAYYKVGRLSTKGRGEKSPGKKKPFWQMVGDGADPLRGWLHPGRRLRRMDPVRRPAGVVRQQTLRRLAGRLPVRLRLRHRLPVFHHRPDAPSFGGQGHLGRDQGRHPVADRLASGHVRLDGSRGLPDLRTRIGEDRPGVLVHDANRHALRLPDQLPRQLVAVALRAERENVKRGRAPPYNSFRALRRPLIIKRVADHASGEDPRPEGLFCHEPDARAARRRPPADFLVPRASGRRGPGLRHDGGPGDGAGVARPRRPHVLLLLPVLCVKVRGRPRPLPRRAGERPA